MPPRLPPGRRPEPSLAAARGGGRSGGRSVLATVVLGAPGLLLGACGDTGFGAPDPASAQGEQIHDLYRWFAAIATGVGVFVTALLVYVVIRFRRRSDDVPSQKAYNIPVEILYTAIPLIIVAVLFGYSVRTEESVNALVDDPDLVVDVTGFQWQWQFDYPELDITVTGTPGGGLPELVLPVDRTARLDLRTADVNHNFWVPAFLNKRDLIPGVDNEIDVTPTRTGSFDGVCAEFCGLDHGRMRFVLRVVDADEFDRWVEEQAR